MKDDEKGKGPKKEEEEEGNVIAFKKEKEESDRSAQNNQPSKKLQVPVKEEEEEEEGVEIVRLTADEGAIVFKKEGMDLIVPTGENLADDSDSGSDFDEVINTITYLLYALERDDWKDEFILVLKKQIQKDEKDDHEAETKRRRSHLKVIK